MSHESTSTKPSPVRKQRWFRFSLRTFLLVVTVLCIWLGIKVNAAREQRQAVAAVRELGGRVRYDYEIVPGFVLPNSPHPEPGWYAKLLGVDYFYNVVELGSRWNASKDFGGMLPHCQLPRIRTVMLDDATLNDRDLQYLVDLKELELLWLTNNNITGEGFKYLVKLRKLKMISVKGNPIVDQSLEAISTLPDLEQLDLISTKATDACIATLGKIPRLSSIDVGGSRITADGVRRLQQLRPNVVVHFWPEQSPELAGLDDIVK